MLLAVDIGNTNTVVGVYDNSRLINHFRVASDHRMTIDECGFFVIGILEKLDVAKDDITRIAVASVVPRLTPVFIRMAEKYFNIKPLIVDSETKLPIKIAYDNPKSVGADRIANAVAAYARFRQAVIAVDFGTTTNFDVIDSKGVYHGGVIAPGPEMSALMLSEKAARLFEVSVERPPGAIGRNTADSIKSGIFFGTIGLVDRLIAMIIEELGEKPKVIATGGLADKFAGESEYIEETIPELTLEGLRIIADGQN